MYDIPKPYKVTLTRVTKYTVELHALNKDDAAEAATEACANGFADETHNDLEVEDTVEA
jgi:hypothetical protein